LKLNLKMKNKNNHEGYIPLFRRFLDNELWTEKRKFSKAEAWIDLLFMARYGKETEKIIDRGELIKIGYGEILTSVKSLSERWGRSRTWVRALLEHLKNKSSIKNIRKDRRRTIIKVVKLEYFQNLVKKKTSEKVTERHKKDIRKTYKNKDNKDNKDNIIPSKVLSKKTYGNEKINFIIKEFQERWGYPPTDKRPRFEAWNLVQRIDGFIRAWGKKPTYKYFCRAVNLLFKKILKEDWAEHIQTISIIRRKMPIYLRPPREVKEK